MTNLPTNFMLGAMARYMSSEALPPLTRYENRYCQGCLATVRHEVHGVTYTCLRCNSVKRPMALLAASK